MRTIGHRVLHGLDQLALENWQTAEAFELRLGAEAVRVAKKRARLEALSHTYRAAEALAEDVAPEEHKPNPYVLILQSMRERAAAAKAANAAKKAEMDQIWNEQRRVARAFVPCPTREIWRGSVLSW